MADEYTPTTEQVREFWASDGQHQPAAKSFRPLESEAEFDRWLAAHDADLTARLAAALAANAEMKTMYQELNTLQDAVVEEHAELESRLAAAEQTIEDALVASRASSVPLGMPEASFYRRVLRESERILSAYRPVAAHPTTESEKSE